MSQLNNENDYGNMTTVMRHVLRQFTKNIHTNCPGIVESYTPGSKRIQVRPALRPMPLSLIHI